MSLRGEKSPQWRGGRSRDHKGYVSILAPDHPRARSKGYVFEHLLVAEKAMGRHLPPGAQVHHVDECKSNNASSNLVICPDTAYHALLHRRMRAFAATGNPDAVRCDYCKSYDRQDEIHRRSLYGKLKIQRGWHRQCQNEYERNRKRAKRLAQRNGQPIGPTARQMEVARLAALGLSYREIAQRLGVSSGTAESHIVALAKRLFGDRGRAMRRVRAWMAEHTDAA